MNSKKLWYWVGAVTFLVIFWGLIGHLVMPKHVDLRKPINYDKPKLDTVTFDDGHTEVFKLDTAD